MNPVKTSLFLLAFVSLLPLFISSAKAQYQISQSQLNTLKLNISLAEIELKALKEELAIANNDVSRLKTDLNNAEKSLTDSLKKQDEYRIELITESKRRKNATIAGILLGAAMGSGTALTVTGAVTKNQPLTWSGLGVAGTGFIVWITGYLLEVW